MTRRKTQATDPDYGSHCTPSAGHACPIVGRSAISLTMVVLCLMLTESTAGRNASDEQFVTGLVERRLFDLAAIECRNQLTNPSLAVRQRVDWTVELIRVLGQHAANSVPAERAAIWSRAHDTAKQFLDPPSEIPGAILVQVQDALTYLAEGELARMEAEVAADPQSALDRARQTIRQSARALEDLDKQLTEAVARANGRNEAGESLSADELFSLQNNVRFQWARAHRNQALCYPHKSDDRLAALSMAVEQLKRTLSQLRSDGPLVWQVYLDLAVCYRLLNDLEQAQRALKKPQEEAAPAGIRIHADSEEARLAIAAGDPQLAVDRLDRARSKWPPAAGEPPSVRQARADLDFAQLEAVLSFWKAATAGKDEQLAAQWQKKSTAAVAYIERIHGPYWGRRAELQLLSVADRGSGMGNVEIMGRTAANLYQKQQFDEAIATYKRAADKARAGGNLSAAFELEYMAGLIEQKLEKHQDASRRFERLALEQKMRPTAAQTHLLAAWNAAQVVRKESQAATRYAALLERHLEEWPADPTANKARNLLGRWREGERDWEAALAAYTHITADDELFESAVTAAARCWSRWLQQQEATDQPVAEIATQATQFFDSLILGPEKQWPERWTAAQRQAAVATARVRLEYLENGNADAQRVLQVALDACPDASGQWREEVQTLLIVALAGIPGQQEAARQLFEQSSSGSTDRLLEVINGLSALNDSATPKMQAQLAELQLTALDQLKSRNDSLDEKQLLRIRQIRAAALRATGKKKEALAILQQLAASHSNNGQVQIELAEMLLDSDSPELLSQAITQWQKVARRVRPDSLKWYQARYAIALALYKRNRPADQNERADRDVAAQRLQYLKATSNVDETTWKAKIDDLLKRCEGE